ncbi:MAG: hypothetical protein IM587_12025, partial [Chitinophagaceae bacterium]|nr:hypothetical protein [Chitinophagaceae bacterium]
MLLTLLTVLHGQTMHVRSKLDVGTTIGFTLEARKDQGMMNVEQGMMNVEWERR